MFSKRSLYLLSRCLAGLNEDLELVGDHIQEGVHLLWVETSKLHMEPLLPDLLGRYLHEWPSLPEALREVHEAANQESSCKIDSQQDDDGREIEAPSRHGEIPADSVEDGLGGLVEEADDGVIRVGADPRDDYRPDDYPHVGPKHIAQYQRHSLEEVAKDKHVRLR